MCDLDAENWLKETFGEYPIWSTHLQKSDEKEPVVQRKKVRKPTVEIERKCHTLCQDIDF